MALRRDLARRSPKEWIVRLALVAVVLIFGYYSVTFSIAQVVVGRAPGLAYRLASYDGRIIAAYATSLAGEDATPQDRTRADALAKRALQRDPTAVAAAATLGVDADIRGNNAIARQYFTYAQKLSRRDLRTQLFMIEDAVDHGDVSTALHQYDITLRVFPGMGELFYPVMIRANVDPVIRQALVKILEAKPLWAESFVNFASDNSPDPKSTAALFLELRRAGFSVPASARANAVDALLKKGQFDAAWSYYAATRSNADRRRSRDPKFGTTAEMPSQLDWTSINDGSGLTTNLQSGVFDFAAPASVAGPMLQQLQLLLPGTYRLSGHSVGIDQAPSALPYWTLRCQDGPELGRVEVPNSSVAGGNFSGTFSISAECPVQMLVLIARPSDAVSGLSGQFDRVELVPVAK